MNSARESFRYIPAAAALLCAFLLLSCSDGDMVTPPPAGPDTTSHDFVWDITQIGVRHTAIRDIAAIAEDDVWLCGEIHFEDTYTYDSNGVYIQPYNLAHWDGKEWTFQRLKWQGDNPIAVKDIHAMKAFASDDIWFFTGGDIAHWNGNSFETQKVPLNIPEGSFLHLMDGYPGNLYLAGTRGAIMHFDCNKTFTRVLVPLLRDINDIHSSNGITMAVMNNWNIDEENDTYVLVIEGTKLHRLWREFKMYKGAKGIWFEDSSRIFIAGPGTGHYQNGEWGSLLSPDNKFLEAVSGTADNDVFVAGHFSSIQHYNGKSWNIYEGHVPRGDILFSELDNIPGHIYAIGVDHSGIFHFVHGRRVTQ